MEQGVKQDEIEIDLRELIAIFMKRAWIIVASTIIVGMIAYLISEFVLIPKYQSSTQIYVMNKQNENTTITYSDIQSGTQLTKDYMTLVTSRPVIDQVNAELNLAMKYSEIVSLIKVSNPDNTRILKISVEFTDPFLAKDIADAIRDASADHIKKVMDIDQVNVIEYANIPEGKSSPHKLRNTIIGAFIGCVFAGLIILLIHIMDDTIKTSEDVERFLGLSVLSSIPIQEELKEINKKKKTKKSSSTK